MYTGELVSVADERRYKMKTLLEQLSRPKKIKRIEESLTKVGNEKALIIYRGESESSSPYTHEGISSWTLDEGLASYMASSPYSEEGRIYRAKVKLDNVLVYDN